MDLGDQLRLSFNSAIAALVGALPAIIGATVILIVGWITATVVGRIVTSLLGRVGADRLLAQRGADVYGANAQAISVSRVGGQLAKWVVFLVFVVAATTFLGWPLVTDLLNRIILFIPNLVVAAIILIFAPIGGRILRRVIEGATATAGIASGAILGRIAEIAVIILGVVVAINQVGIASDLVNILFTGLVLALAVAVGLAFGLGGREVAGQLLQDWYDRSRGAADKAAAAASTSSPSQRRPGAAAKSSSEA